MSAEYPPPTPWQATLSDPMADFRSLQVAGPTVDPFEMLARGNFQRSAFAELTMLPISVEPRAKIKITGLQLPLVSSFDVVDVPN
jgi:hypothetical protein